MTFNNDLKLNYDLSEMPGKNMSSDSCKASETTLNMEGEHGSSRSGRGAKIKKITKKFLKKVRIKIFILYYLIVKKTKKKENNLKFKLTQKRLRLKKKIK